MRSAKEILKEFKEANLPSQEEVMACWPARFDKPKVSIRCLAYNHEKFIEDALKGFLIQKTTFPFEILIHDDASTDDTAKILREYEEKYPLIIKVVYQTENQYSQGIKPIRYLHEITRGEYIAACEGDDFWTDPNKLAIQVKYLDENPDVVISSHDAMIINEREEIIVESKLNKTSKRDFSAKELQQCKPLLLTLGWVYRNIDIPVIPERMMVKNGDTFLISILGAFGGSHYHEDIQVAAYRAHEGGVWSGIELVEKYESSMITKYHLAKYYQRTGNKKLSTLHRKEYLHNQAATLSFFESILLLIKTVLFKVRRLILN